jgi:hypothetical protein
MNSLHEFVPLGLDGTQRQKDNLRLYINLKLASSGQPPVRGQQSDEFMDVAHDLLMAYRAKNWLLSNYLNPPDRRIQDFLERYLHGIDNIPQLPGQSFILDHEGLARELSLPVDSDVFRSDIVSSYRVRQGVLHNPASDRRTTHGLFHVAEGGLPIPSDKKAVPREVFARMLAMAFEPPQDLLTLPFTVNQPQPSRMFVSLLLRPVICPAIPGVAPEKRMETASSRRAIWFQQSGFRRKHFRQCGDPTLPQNDAAWMPNTGAATRLRDAGAASDRPAEAGTRPAALG